MIAPLIQSFTLPLTLRNWPWERQIDPFYEEARAESSAWIESFHPFSPQKMAAFNKCNFALLCALTFPEANMFNLRSCCDLMNVFFALDEYVDAVGPEQARHICNITLDATLNPDKPRPKNEHVIGEITRQFWSRSRQKVPGPAQKRFIEAWTRYLASMVEESERRADSYVCTLEEYLLARRENVGTGPLLAFLETTLELDFPQDVMEHPVLVELERHTTEMIILANDMCSYRKEILADDANYNAVTIVMHDHGVDLQGAMQWISNRHDDNITKFIMLKQQVIERQDFPSFGTDLDNQLARFIDGLGQWVRGHDEWLFASPRYFGDKGSEIKKSRVVSLHQ